MNKTKKALLAALACSAVLAGAAGLAACTDGNGSGAHKHSWTWSVTEEPTAIDSGKATGTCSGSGTCNATAEEKEVTLPALVSDEYEVTDTATCQAAGTATYTYNKDGVNVSFTVDTAINRENHVDGCGHHKHVWSDWTLEANDIFNFNGTATRECIAETEEECDATDEDLFVTVLSIRSSGYPYGEPIHKTPATCTEKGVDTYTYKDVEKRVTVTFDVESDYAEHNYVNGECSVCHKTIKNLTLNQELTLEVTSDEEEIVEFTAPADGMYEILYTEGSDAKVVLSNGLVTQLPYSYTFSEGGKVSLAISCPEGVADATYKIMAVPVASLAANRGTEENPVDPTKVPSTTTVNVGGGKFARLNVGSYGYGIISYEGETPITVSYYTNVLGQGRQDYSYTLVKDGQESFTANFGMGYDVIKMTITSDAEAAFDAELSLIVSEEDPDKANEITVGVPKSFKGASYMNVLVYDLAINYDDNYTFTVYGDNKDDVILSIGTEYDPEAFDVTDPLEANEDGSYTLVAGTTYKVVIYSMKEDMTTSSGYAEIDGIITVAQAEDNRTITVGEAFTVTGASNDSPKKYTVELEAGNYQVYINGTAIDLTAAAKVLIGSGYDGYGIILLDYKTEPFEFEGEIIQKSIDNVVVVPTTGTYYLEVYSDVTFTIVTEGTEVGGGTTDENILTTDGKTVKVEYGINIDLMLVAQSDENPNGFEDGKTYVLTLDNPEVLFNKPEGGMTGSLEIIYSEGMTVNLTYIGWDDYGNANITVDEYEETEDPGESGD